MDTKRFVDPENWQPDVLPGFEQRALPVEETSAEVMDPEGEPAGLYAVLVRAAGGSRSRKAVLYVHGWNDYFFQTHLADFWAEQGYDFFAIDLRRYGRAYRDGQTFGWITDLRDYNVELDAAYDLIATDHDHVLIQGHSTGGLTTALHADARPGRFSAVLLNSPWLDVRGSWLTRALVGPLVTVLGERRPNTVVPAEDNGFYRRSILASEDGEWDYDLTIKGIGTPTVGWLRAIVRGQAKVAVGLDIDCPVLVQCSTQSYFGKHWGPEALASDTVLDVDQIVARATKLGSLVTIARVHEGLHDLALSRQPARDEFFAQIERWLKAYGPRVA